MFTDLLKVLHTLASHQAPEPDPQESAHAGWQGQAGVGAAAGQVHRDSPNLHCRQCQQRSGGVAEWVHSEDGVS